MARRCRLPQHRRACEHRKGEDRLARNERDEPLAAVTIPAIRLFLECRNDGVAICCAEPQKTADQRELHDDEPTIWRRPKRRHAADFRPRVEGTRRQHGEHANTGEPREPAGDRGEHRDLPRAAVGQDRDGQADQAARPGTRGDDVDGIADDTRRDVAPIGRVAAERGRECDGDDDHERGGARARALEAYAREESDWLEEYALFAAIHDEHGSVAWMDWPAPLRDQDPAALAEARVRLADAIAEKRYIQWIADVQWRAARQAAHDGGVELMGDLPFLVAPDSADIWSRA